jgi:Cu-Zn family superoxide dismutase
MNIRNLAMIFVAVALGACAHKETDGGASETSKASTLPELTSAQAQLQSAGKGKISGVIAFVKTESGVLVKADLKGFKKGSIHGLHIHENGDCSAPDFKSAGGHYNPSGQPHGDPQMADHHAGDFGNVKADKKGRVKFEKEFKGISINGNLNPILGKAVVVHAKADDLKSQPSGDSGDRIACGVIQ